MFDSLLIKEGYSYKHYATTHRSRVERMKLCQSTSLYMRKTTLRAHIFFSQAKCTAKYQYNYFRLNYTLEITQKPSLVSDVIPKNIYDSH